MWWSDPLWLLALPVILLVVFWGRSPATATGLRSGQPAAGAPGRGSLRRLTILRAGAVASALLALAGTTILVPSQRRQVVVLIDVSRSLGPNVVEAARRSAMSALDQLAADDRVAVITFAGRPALAVAPTGADQALSQLAAVGMSAPQPERTDLVAALKAGFSILSEERYGDRCLLLFSDGRPTVGGGVEDELQQFAGVPIHIVPLGEPGVGLITQEFAVPKSIRAGEWAAATWKVTSSEGRDVTVTILADGKPAARRRLSVPAGYSAIRLEVPSQAVGLHRVELEVTDDATGEALPQAACGALLRVQGPAQVLVVREESSSEVAKALRVQGFHVREQSSARLAETAVGLATFAAVVLDNVPAYRISAAQQEALREYVAGGGGLLVVGGDSSLGRGEYYDSVLEELLPVQTDTRRRLYFTRASLLFVIDHSGSMTEMVGDTSKQLAAMRAVAAAARELNAYDEVGILTFDEEATWVLPFTPADRRAEIAAAIANIPEGGGTDMTSALVEAARGFEGRGPARRHVVIFTDGLTAGGKKFEELCQKLRAMDATITTVAIGEEVNEKLLRQVAEWGQGRYYRAELDQVPRVVRQETVRISRDLIQEGSFRPAVATSGEVLQGLDQGCPPVLGYLVTKAKSLATVHLTVGEGDPLLAAWRYGDGRVAVFASDSGRRWLAPWSGTPFYNRLWSQVVRFLERGGEGGPGLDLYVLAEGGTVRAVVEAVGDDRRLRTGLQLVGRYAGRSFDLAETAPGRYEAEVPLETEGFQEFEVLDPQTGAWTIGGLWYPQGVELRSLGPDLALLGRLCADSGGRILRPEAPVLPAVRRSWTPVPLGSFLAFLALALFLAELGFRSLALGQLAMARAALAVWRQAQESLINLATRAQYHVDTQTGGDRVTAAHRYLAERMKRAREKGN